MGMSLGTWNDGSGGQERRPGWRCGSGSHKHKAVVDILGEEELSYGVCTKEPREKSRS